eukprot:CAMPEP_0202344146 /NCGR_PEP_ID=MMETSP1126-20121109/3966_1 /ASSEMBLY_ACC=CAM_ASM_000457 /TAXON_ID=3047 /ORGANISM="Dunaliella tertiolecta, Strain CCMP1320" /LENGTH=305 /DNA_ID=CAMNT_0048935321 /DNA_START=288 /DNA_END=1204 /DNA_ORIENTATION=+
MFNPAYILPHTDCWIAQGSIGSFLPNMQTLSVTRASKGAETLFEKPLPALTTLVTTASLLTFSYVSPACPNVTSLGVIGDGQSDLGLPKKWRPNITRLALLGSFPRTTALVLLGLSPAECAMQELALLDHEEDAPFDWLANVNEAPDCKHLRAVTLALCNDIGPNHVYHLVSQIPGLEEIRVFNCPKVTHQQCQQIMKLRSTQAGGTSSPPQTEEDCVCIAQQQAAEFAQVSDIKAPDYVDRVWKGFYLRLRQPRARLWAEPFDIVCCDAASEDALLYEEGNGRYFLASHAWHAVSRHSWCEKSE